ncbi:MFS transporter [Dehalobacter sp. DCM]|uniref:MFS transporter n=1 Tax=Dehalobacter sp. DCM TaxID=2907827 RepID=UPI0030821610|nr:MFS transporter [Dehalobacter sp. DCM]
MASVISGGPGYFDGMKLGKTHKRFLWLAAIVYIFDQADNATFMYAAPSLMKVLHITPQQIANINSMNFFGMFLGAIFGGWLSDKIGRKRAIMTTVTIFSVGSFLNAVVSTYHLIAAARLITGFGVIATVVIAMVYIAEMMPSENRGKYQGITIASGSISLPLLGSFAAWIIPKGPDNWRIIFLVGSLGIFLLILIHFWFKESPRWLLSKGRAKEAEALVEEISGRRLDLSEEYKKIPKKGSNAEALRVMLSKEYFRRTFVLFFLTFGISGGSIFLTNFYTTALTMGGMAMTTVLTVTALSFWGIPVGDYTSSFFSDRGGRKMPIFIFALIEVVTFFVAGATFLPGVIVIALFIQKIFGAGATTMVWTYLAESFPTNVRNNVVGFIFGTVRLLVSGIQLTLPTLYLTLGWFGMNAANGAVILICALIALVWGERTSKKSLEELNRQV